MSGCGMGPSKDVKNAIFTPQECTQEKSLVGVTHHSEGPFTISCHHVAPTVVLATAFVPTNDIDGAPTELRALLDSGSSVSFISERAVRKLRLVRQSCQLQVSTVGDKRPQSVNGCVKVGLSGKGAKKDFGFTVDALILNRVVGILRVIIRIS